jgi:branched-chain amino acid transport system ATP-binding protein
MPRLPEIPEIPPVLEVRGIDVFYGDVQVLWDVSFEVKKGEIVALIGANGSGKTTTLATISSLLKPRKGSVTYEGEPIHTRPPHDLVHLGIAHVPEARRLFPEMTVRENLLLGALTPEAKKSRPEMLEKVFSIFPRLKEREKQHAGTLSGGEQQMAAIARGLMSKPRLLMLDEPSLGLSPILVADIFRVIREVHEEGVTVLLVEQNVFRTLEVADRAYVLGNGRVVLDGKGAELLANDHIRKTYLGL